VLKIEPEAVVVPDVAVQPGQEGSFVYLIDAESRVQVQPVSVSRQIGGDIVIARGVKAGDLVITEIPQALQPGATVRIAGSEPSQQGKGKKGKGGKKGGKQSEAKAEG
jgi:multidrug efflux system membrane fusion protein